jgi:surface antigen
MLGATIVASQVVSVPVAYAASPATFNYTRGYSVQHGWLCYGWSNGALHCTQGWYRNADGYLVSDVPSWVPNGGAAGTGAQRTASYSATTSSSWTGGSGGASAGIGQWANTGHSAYGMSDFAGDRYAGSFGSCTWYAWYRRQDEPLMQLGDAAQWAYNAGAHGLSTSSVPAVGATAVFQAGVQGASGLGHAAHVESLYGGGWFLVSEMSFYWNGGGWGRVSYRYAHTGAGVSFIY